MQGLRFMRCHHNIVRRYITQISSGTTSARKFGTNRRPTVHALPRDELQRLRTNVFQNRSTLSTEEWCEIRQSVISSYKHINESNIDAVILSICNEPHQLPLAKDYVHHLIATGVEPNVATLGRLLRIYNAAYKARVGDSAGLCQEEQNEILDIYCKLRSKHELLDATTCENLILGLVATVQWRDAEELLEMIKLTSMPSVVAYSELAVKAFSMKEMQLGWQLLEKMLEEGKQPKCEIFMTYLNEISKTPDDFQLKFEELLVFLQKHELIVTEDVVGCIKTLAQRFPAGLTVERTKLSRLGQCSNCGSYMQNISISDLDFATLSHSFLHKVLIRDDVFQKSTPEEVEHFKRFVEKTAPYDCVIDGLNVAYSMGAKKPPHILANLLVSVARYFHYQKKHVLVLGRKHMNSWPNDAIKTIRKYCSVFLTNNLTHDDPFLLYATLKSGQSTDFFSRDLMRSHAYLLGPELKSIFRRWQQEHQYSLITQTVTGKIIVKEPTRHLVCAHKVNNTWHIPYKLEYSLNPPENFDVPEHWLCLKLQK